GWRGRPAPARRGRGAGGTRAVPAPGQAAARRRPTKPYDQKRQDGPAGPAPRNPNARKPPSTYGKLMLIGSQSSPIDIGIGGAGAGAGGAACGAAVASR